MASESEKAPQGKRPVVAVFPLKAIGHLQMFLPIVKELLNRGTEVHMFLDKMGDDSKVEEVLGSLAALGMKRYPFVTYLDGDLSGDPIEMDLYQKKYKAILEAENLSCPAHKQFILGIHCIYFDLIPIIVEKFKEIKPSSIFFDTCHIVGPILGKILHIPTIGYVSYPGPGAVDVKALGFDVFTNDDVVTFRKKFYKPIWDEYHVDVMQEIYGNPGPVYYSDYINVVTTIEELAQTESELHAKRLHTFKYIGPAIDESVRLNATVTSKAKDEKDKHDDELNPSPAGAASAPAHSFLDVTADIPWKAVMDAKHSGKQIICLSFGTVVTGDGWDDKWTVSAEEKEAKEGADNDDEAKGKAEEAKETQAEEDDGKIRFGGAKTGKELCQRMWQYLFEAFGEDSDVLFITSIGKHEDALKGEGLQVPSNFVVRQQIPQVKVLEHADVLITHGGWNSLQESLQHGVPMLILPGFADQPINARKISEAGAGIGIDEPYLNASVDLLKSSLNTLLHEDTYKTNSEALGKKLTESNGLKHAADIILSSVK